MKKYAKRFLLVGGLGHTDLSGKVPRPGLLMLRRALQKAGHEAEVRNLTTSLALRMFPPEKVRDCARLYHRSIKPVVIEGISPLRHPLPYLRLPLDMRKLIRISQGFREIETSLMRQLGHEIADEVSQKKIDAIGFSLYLGSSTTGAMIMADILRRVHPDLPIFFGGPQTTHFSRTIYQETSAPTALVCGEGEITIVCLAEVISELQSGNLDVLSQIPNLVFRTSEGKLVETPRKRLSPEDWVEASSDIYCHDDFDGVFRYAFIEGSRGCKYGCRFCPQPLLSGRERYLKPGDRIVDEMTALYDRFGITHFELVGSSTPHAQAEEIADHLILRDLAGRFRWAFFMRGKDERPQKTDLPGLMEKLKQAGVCAIFFGVEGASNQTLELMGKGERIEDIKASMLAAKQAGIATIGSFIYPYPGMLPDEGRRILDFLKEVGPLSAPTQPLGLYPGTYCAEHTKEIGMQILYPDKKDQQAFVKGKKPEASMKSPEVLRYLLRYPLILSLPLRFWPPLPWHINGLNYRETVKQVNALQKRMGKLNILTGLSHSHVLIAEVLGWDPAELTERLFYCSITGDPEATDAIIARFNAG